VSLYYRIKLARSGECVPEMETAAGARLHIHQ
jgi:hypothetical protein